ncbi:MAG: ATP cone domain-containing protein [bacterium]|nr:ATP cone domain-containing protein [bacterium]
MSKQKFESVRKRDGRVVFFDRQKIYNAVYRAMQATGEGELSRDPGILTDSVIKELEKKFPNEYVPHIEEIQDLVEESLILSDFSKVAKAYILYRNERSNVRDKVKDVPEHVQQLAQMSKSYFRNPLSEFIYYRSYSRWIEDEGRRETWIETVGRYIDFMKENLGNKLKEKECEEIREAILKQEVMPSMRLMWSAGKAAKKTNVTAYNCSFIAPSKLPDFAEIMYLSMCGAGVGFSVESQTVGMLPIIKRQTGKMLITHVIEDSKEGWGDALTHGLKTWYSGHDVKFDYSALRPAGARLMTMGGRSSGPEPLRALLDFARTKILSRQGKRLSTVDVHDVICKIGEVVVMGGVRRTALISLSDLDDDKMRDSKAGKFYLTEPQRSMANNSATYNSKPTTTEFLGEWLALAQSGSGERGIFNRGGLEKQMPERRFKKFKKHLATSGTNPCVSGDTLVYVADGRGHVSIKQLTEEGKDVPVFCLDNKNKTVVRYMRNPRVTGFREPIYRMMLDDGSSVKATANHKFRLKTGEYRQVKDLHPGDSLQIITKFEASIKDIFPKANSRSQDYWWLNSGKTNNAAEHRVIAEFYYNTQIPKDFVVHHRDRNAQNNTPENLELLSKQAHDSLHSSLMIGDANPMKRALFEWNEQKWIEYRAKHSKNNTGTRNKNFSGITDEELREHALALSKKLEKRFTNKDWIYYAKENGLPQFFSKWRRDHLDGVLGLAKWAAIELGFDYADADPRVVASYKKYTKDGYNCEIRDGQVVIKKNCEVCGKRFEAGIGRREYGVCGISCGLKRAWSNPELKSDFVDRLNEVHHKRKELRRMEQAKIFTDLKFKIGREPLKIEWLSACRENNISSEIARVSSPFRTYENLREFAEMYNHKVASIEFIGYEDVYNGTVDEYHNYFVGGFASETRNGKRKLVYLNNLQCGEIILRSKSFCNLTEVVARAEDTEKTLLRKIELATILGTYQSTLTNFPYLSKEWKQNCDEERLLGVSITGQWDSHAARNPKTLTKMREYAIEVNKEYAKRFGVNRSASITCVKPSGTVSQLVDASSGMHPRHAKFYIRRVRIAASDSLFQMLKEQKFPYYPEVGQSSESASTYVLEFPVKAPGGSIFKDDLSAIEQLEYWKKVKENYTEHNPSVTISVGNDEWIETSNWLYKNWPILGGLSFLPREDHVYQLAPYEEITEERYKELTAKLPQVDFSYIVTYEKDDQTQGAKELACVSGVCEVELPAVAMPVNSEINPVRSESSNESTA